MKCHIKYEAHFTLWHYFVQKIVPKKKKENASKPCLSHAEIDNEIITNLTAVGG